MKRICPRFCAVASGQLPAGASWPSPIGGQRDPPPLRRLVCIEGPLRHHPHPTSASDDDEGHGRERWRFVDLPDRVADDIDHL